MTTTREALSRGLRLIAAEFEAREKSDAKLFRLFEEVKQLLVDGAASQGRTHQLLIQEASDLGAKIKKIDERLTREEARP